MRYQKLSRALLLLTLTLGGAANATTGSHTVAPAAGAPTLDSVGTTNTRPELCQPSAGVVVTPEQFGANGDDALDDSAALQAAVRSCGGPCTVQLGVGKWYRLQWGTGSNAVLHLDRPHVQLRGNGANGGIYVVTSDEQAQCSFTGGSPTGTPGCVQTNGQAIHLAAPNTDIVNVSITSNIRFRSAGNPQGAALWLDSTEHDVCGVRLEYAPIYVRGASNYRITGNAIWRSYSDPIHQTDLSSTQTTRVGNAVVSWNHIAQSGDDGVAVIDRGTANLSGYVITDNTIEDGYWGRGIGVDGGDNIRIEHNTIRRQVMAASILVHADTNAFGAAKTTRVVVRGNTIDGNQQSIEPPWHPCHTHWPGGTGTQWNIFQFCLTDTAGNIGWKPAVMLTDHAAIDVMGRDNSGDLRPPEDSRVSDLVIDANTVTNAVRGGIRVRDIVCNVKVTKNVFSNISTNMWRESYTNVPNGGTKAAAQTLCALSGSNAGVTACLVNTNAGAPMNCP